jgi:two-component system response regulator DevR
MKPISVLLVDDHQVVRQGVRAILDAEPHFTVMGEAANGTEALSIVKSHHPDIVILDLKLPDITGADLCQQILASSPKTIVIILTAYFEYDLVYECLQAGARGYLIKDAEQLNLAEKLKAAMQGHIALDPRATDILVNYVRRKKLLPETLTDREMDVINLMSQGLTNREIANKLQLTENTIKGYVKEIFTKLGARNRIEAVTLARKRGML